MSSQTKQKIYAILWILLIVLVCLPLVRNWRQKRAVESEISDFKKEISSKEVDNKKLRDTISYFQSDSSLEETARLNLGLKKPGENVAVIKEELGTSSGLLPETKAESNYLKWFKYFFK
ncbi:MAG: septum formation initiator family protein [Candidatus Falkowbacteria bacterium]|nr:septum formation initiator family protein [Candidatus Falkowbacteria bacterium]